MKVVLVGDMHGRSDFVHKILQFERPEFALQVGDYMAYNESWEAPLGWISGNWDKRDVVDALEQDQLVLPGNNFYLKAGELYTIAGKDILTLPTFCDYKREHRSPAGILSEHIDKCSSHIGKNIDIFISHGCGYPFIAKTAFGTKNVEEKEVTNIIKLLKPKYVVSGHIHHPSYMEQDGIKFYRMGYQQSCVINI